MEEVRNTTRSRKINVKMTERHGQSFEENEKGRHMPLECGGAFQRRDSKCKDAEVFVFGVLRNSKGPRILKME